MQAHIAEFIGTMLLLMLGCGVMAGLLIGCALAAGVKIAAGS